MRKNKKHNQKRAEIPLGTVISGFCKGVGGLLGFAAKLENDGKDEYVEEGEIEGKTKSGKAYKGAYGFRVKLGLPSIAKRRRRALIRRS